MAWIRPHLNPTSGNYKGQSLSLTLPSLVTMCLLHRLRLPAVTHEDKVSKEHG